jgi:hypothetical protein
MQWVKYMNSFLFRKSLEPTAFSAQNAYFCIRINPVPNPYLLALLYGEEPRY